MEPTEEQKMVNRVAHQHRPDMYGMVDAIFMYLVDDATQEMGEEPDGADLVDHWRHAKQLLIDYVNYRLPTEWTREIGDL